jgi:hypothetical protein
MGRHTRQAIVEYVETIIVSKQANTGGMAYPAGHAPPPDGYGPPDNGGYGPPDAGGFGPSNPSWQYPSPGGAPAQGMGPGHAQPPSYAPAPGPGLRSIYVSGLPDEADELTLYRIFALYGAIESCKVGSWYRTSVLRPAVSSYHAFHFGFFCAP